VTGRRFQPSGPLRGRLLAAPDKSISHRAALLAAMSEGTCAIDGYLDAADTRSTLAAVEALGAGVAVEDGADGLRVRIEGIRIDGPRPGTSIDAGNAGTLIRLISGWLAGRAGSNFEIDGDESIRRRPMGRIAEPLRLMGAQIDAAAGDRPPLRIAGAELQGIDYDMPVASAQVKSCVLLAGIQAGGETKVREPERTRDHTERMLRSAGIDVRIEERTALPTAPPPTIVTVTRAEQPLRLPSLRVPGDLSSAAFHLVAAALVPGSEVSLERVGLNPTRVGLLGILTRMGARITVEETGWEAGEPVGTVSARHGALEGTRVGGAEVPLAIDELPLVGLLGCFAEGETVVTGAEELRHKESDRIATVVDGLRALGGRVEALDDGFVVTGSGGLDGGTIDAGGDHRIAMLGAVAGLASSNGVAVEGMEAAAISYPGFESDLGSLLGG
jgi:3-phosphoshikimate 1-carboxyvinyltransferase